MIRHHIVAEHGLAVLIWRGAVLDEEMGPAYRALYAEPAWCPGMDLLVDVRGVNPDGITGAGLRALANLVGERAGSEPFKTAVLVSRDVGHGLARMYAAYGADSPETVRIFREPAEALQWLGGPADLELPEPGDAGLD